MSLSYYRRRSKWLSYSIIDLLNENEALAMLISALALAFIYSGFFSIIRKGPYYFMIVLALTAPSFLIHELCHRQIARRHGFYSKYVIFPMWFLISLLTAFFPFIRLIALGSVVVYGYAISSRTYMKIALAGPLSNMIMAALGIFLSSFTRYPLSLYLHMFSSINSWYAFFNLLPIPPLDGSKVFQTSIHVWLMAFLVSIILLMLT